MLTESMVCTHRLEDQYRRFIVNFAKVVRIDRVACARDEQVSIENEFSRKFNHLPNVKLDYLSLTLLRMPHRWILHWVDTAM